MKVFKKAAFALLAPVALVFGQTTVAPPSAAPGQGSQTITGVQARPEPGMVSPGTINYIEGQVSLDGQPLDPAKSVVLQPGQTLATGNGFAEVLLTPGAFLRIGHNSQVGLVTAGLVDTKAQLDRGTAIVEVDQLIKGTNLTVAMNGAAAQIEKTGLYDFDASQRSVKVLDGKASVMEIAGSKTIGKNDQLLLASAKPLQKTSFDRREVEARPLYVWSRARGGYESQANVALASNVAAYGGWNGPGWYWDPYWSFYSYLPGNGFLYSPFGSGFYSPGFAGYYGAPFGHYGHYRGWQGHAGRVGGVNARIHGSNSGFHGGTAGGFHGGSTGSFHGGGHR